MIRAISRIFLAAVIIVYCPTAAHAQRALGDPSSHYIPGYTPKAVPFIAPKSIPPVLVIRFNRKNVYFKEALKKVVGKVDKSKPAAHYELENILPGGSNKDNGYGENIRNVVKVFGILGVPAGNVAIRTKYSNTVMTQEVRVYVK